MKDSKEALERLYLGLEDYDTQAKCYELIFKDLDRLEKLEKENKELRKSIKSWNETAGNLLKENIKLKKAIEILKGFKIDLIDYCDGHYSLEILYDTGGLTKEEYELLEEILNN